jgi:hypothetical protein
MFPVLKRTIVRFLTAAVCVFVTQASLAIPIEDMGQIAIAVYFYDTASSDPPEMVGSGFIQYDRAFVESEVANHSDEFFFSVLLPIINGSFEMFGVTFDESDIQWEHGYDLGNLERIFVSMANEAGDTFQFGADTEDSAFHFAFLNGYSGQASGFPCFVSTPNGPWSGSGESLLCEFDAQEVPVSAVPESGTLALLGLGLLGLGLSTRRRLTLRSTQITETAAIARAVPVSTAD